MKPHFSLTQYKTFDLIVFAVMLTFVEVVIALASSKWFPDQLYTVSAVAGVTAIVMVRWKWFGAIHAVIGALAMCIITKSSPIQILVYCIGNLFALGGIFIAKLIKEERMRKNGLLAVLYGISVVILMQTGRAVLSLILGYGFKSAIAFYVTDSLSIVFTALIVFVASKQDGLLENQISYIRRIQEDDDKN